MNKTSFCGKGKTLHERGLVLFYADVYYGDSKMHRKLSGNIKIQKIVIRIGYPQRIQHYPILFRGRNGVIGVCAKSAVYPSLSSY